MIPLQVFIPPPQRIKTGSRIPPPTNKLGSLLLLLLGPPHYIYTWLPQVVQTCPYTWTSSVHCPLFPQARGRWSSFPGALFSGLLLYPAMPCNTCQLENLSPLVSDTKRPRTSPCQLLWTRFLQHLMARHIHGDIQSNSPVSRVPSSTPLFPPSPILSSLDVCRDASLHTQDAQGLENLLPPPAFLRAWTSD